MQAGRTSTVVGDDALGEAEAPAERALDEGVGRQPLADGRGSGWFVTRHGLRDELLGFLAARGLGAHRVTSTRGVCEQSP
jgi:hypothetical protein